MKDFVKLLVWGDVLVKTCIRCKLQLNNARHIPDICLNLMVVNTLDIEGYCTYFGGGGLCKITKGSFVQGGCHCS